MNTAEHPDILRTGVSVWNEWRRANPDIVPDLHMASLMNRDLHGADLRGANLEWADLLASDLSRADLRQANFHGVDARNSKFMNAQLQGANLYGAVLIDSDLTGGDLTGSCVMVFRLGMFSLTAPSNRAWQLLVLTNPKSQSTISR